MMDDRARTLEISDAYSRLQSTKRGAAYDWVVLGLLTHTTKLTLVEAGTGYMHELREYLDDTDVRFVALKVLVVRKSGAQDAKYVQFNCIGERVSAFKRGKLSQVMAQVGQFFHNIAYSFDTHNWQELNIYRVAKRIQEDELKSQDRPVHYLFSEGEMITCVQLATQKEEDFYKLGPPPRRPVPQPRSVVERSQSQTTERRPSLNAHQPPPPRGTRRPSLNVSTSPTKSGPSSPPPPRLPTSSSLPNATSLPAYDSSSPPLNSSPASSPKPPPGGPPARRSSSSSSFTQTTPSALAAQHRPPPPAGAGHGLAEGSHATSPTSPTTPHYPAPPSQPRDQASPSRRARRDSAQQQTINSVMAEYEKLIGTSGKKVKQDLKQAVNSALELLETEKTYVKNLKTMANFHERLKILTQMDRIGMPGYKWTFGEEEVRKMFLNLPDLYEMHYSMYVELKKWRNQPNKDLHRHLGPDGHGDLSHVGDLLLQMGSVMCNYIPYFKLYISYVNDYAKATQKLQEARLKFPDFDFFIDYNSKVAKIQDLQSLMITPVQRLPRYILLMGEMLNSGAGVGDLKAEKQEDKDKKEGAKKLGEAFKKMQAIALEVNESFRLQEAREKVVLYDKRVRSVAQVVSDRYPRLEFSDTGSKRSLVTPSRYFVREGTMLKKKSKGFGLRAYNKCFVLLFNDLILFTTVPSDMEKGRMTALDILPLLDTKTSDPPLDPKKKSSKSKTLPQHPFSMIHELGISQDGTVLTEEVKVRCDSAEDKAAWMNDIKRMANKLSQSHDSRKAAAIAQGVNLDKKQPTTKSGQSHDDEDSGDEEETLSESKFGPMDPPSQVESHAIASMTGGSVTRLSTPGGSQSTISSSPSSSPPPRMPPPRRPSFTVNGQ